MLLASGYGVAAVAGGNIVSENCNSLALDPTQHQKAYRVDIGRTCTVLLKSVWSSESAPMRMTGVIPVRCSRLASALRKNEFGADSPAQSVHLSCSSENDKSAGSSVGADEGAVSGTETVSCETPASGAGAADAGDSDVVGDGPDVVAARATASERSGRRVASIGDHGGCWPFELRIL